MSTHCPLCHKPVSKPLTQTIRGGVSRRVLWCPRCDLGVLEGGLQENKDGAEEYYKKEYRRKHSHRVSAGAAARELFEAYEPFQGDRMRLLGPVMNKKKTLLEIGCSAGMFLYHARAKMGRVLGVDYDAPAAAYAAKVCKCTTYGTDITKTPIPKASADIVCAFQTLEHVVDPVGFIKTAGEYLTRGGTIAVEVPNLHDALISLYDLPNHYQFYFHEAHLWYFSEKSLRKAMRQAGFEGKVVFIQDYNLLNHLHWADMDAPAGGGTKGLRAPELPLRTTASPKARAEVGRLIATADSDYKKFLDKHKITSNLFFIGKKK
jgi:SAM-dependent methyltransferase